MTGWTLVSMGSNIEPETNLEAALESLAARVPIVAASRVFVTKAVAERPMPDFFNAAVEIRTDRTPGELKYGILRDLEWRLGRRRTDDRNAPRTIDLDVALHGDRIMKSELLGLEIPAAEILTRVHVALPLADLAPGRPHPVTGESLAEIAARLEATAPAGMIHPAVRSRLLEDLLRCL